MMIHLTLTYSKTNTNLFEAGRAKISPRSIDGSAVVEVITDGGIATIAAFGWICMLDHRGVPFMTLWCS